MSDNVGQRTGRSERLDVRVTAAQARRLRALAERDFEGNLSNAIRAAIRDAELLELAREDYARLVDEQGLRLPLNADDGSTTVLQLVLTRRLAGGGKIEWHESEEPE
jgi:hypothetical protein